MKYELSQKQADYIKGANHRWNGKIGATQCGKTFIDTFYIIPSRIRDRKGSKGLNVITGVSRDTIERNVLEPMRDVWGTVLVGEISSKNTCYIFGEKVYCIGAENEGQVRKFRGMKIKYLYIDEIVDINESVFQLLKSRLSLDNSICDFAGNPAAPTHWCKTFLDGDIDLFVQNYSLFDNPFLPESYVEQLCKEYEGTVYYDRYILGQWKRAEGAIYRRFADNPGKYACEIVATEQMKDGCSEKKQFSKSELLEITIGIDFGGTKSGHAFSATAKTKNYKELISLSSERHFGDIDSKELDELVILFIAKVQKNFGAVEYIYYDNAEPVLGRSIKNAVFDVFPSVFVKGALKKPIKDRIDCFLRLLGTERFYFTEDSETLSKAISECVWNEKCMEDSRLDDGSVDMDSMDSFEYSWERDIKRLIDYEIN